MKVKPGESPLLDANAPAAPVVLNSRPSRDGKATWQARRSEDRGRLQVVAIVPPSDTTTVVEALSDVELRELLTIAPQAGTAWLCVECGTPNEPDRRWCRVCSCHDGTR